MSTAIAHTDLKDRIRLTIKSDNGYVGLGGGLINPDERLHMAGNILMRFDGTGNGDVIISSDLVDETDTEVATSILISTPDRTTAGLAGSITLEPGQGSGFLANASRIILKKRVAMLDNAGITTIYSVPGYGATSSAYYLDPAGSVSTSPVNFEAKNYDRYISFSSGGSGSGSVRTSVYVETAQSSGSYYLPVRQVMDAYESVSWLVPANCTFRVLLEPIGIYKSDIIIVERGFGRNL